MMTRVESYFDAVEKLAQSNDNRAFETVLTLLDKYRMIMHDIQLTCVEGKLLMSYIEMVLMLNFKIEYQEIEKMVFNI